MEKRQFFQWSWNYKGNCLNKDIKKESFKKDLMNFIETNRMIKSIYFRKQDDSTLELASTLKCR